MSTCLLLEYGGTKGITSQMNGWLQILIYNCTVYIIVRVRLAEIVRDVGIRAQILVVKAED